MEITQLDIDDVEFTSGINVTYRVHVKDLGVGYLKLDQGDYGYPNFTPYELSAYRVSEVLGLHVVPLTVAIDHPTFGPSVFSAEVAGAPKNLFYGWGYDPRVDDDQPYETVDIQKIACLDIIIGNTDRHGENYRTADDGRPMGIDHGLCFGARATGSSRFVKWAMKTQNDDVDQSIMALLAAADLDTIETDMLKYGMHHEQIDKVAERLIRLYDQGVIHWSGYGLNSGW